VIHATRDRLAPPGPRLLAAAEARALDRAGAAAIEPASMLVLGATPGDRGAVTPVPADGDYERVLVLSWIGAHRDAREPLLARLWDLEEAARATRRPAIVLRFAPLIGASSPLLAHLARRPRLDARLERSLIQPMHEDEAVEGLARLLAGQVEWAGWFEVCGPEPLTVGELAAYVAAGALGSAEAAPGWEPSPAVIRAQGMAEWEPWARASGVTPRRITGAVVAPA